MNFVLHVCTCTPCIRSLLSTVLSSSRQGGTEKQDLILNAVMVDNGSVVLAGLTTGNWSGENAGVVDFAAVKLDAEGVEVWRWQVGGRCLDRGICFDYIQEYALIYCYLLVFKNERKIRISISVVICINDAVYTTIPSGSYQSSPSIPVDNGPGFVLQIMIALTPLVRLGIDTAHVQNNAYIL